MRKRITGISIDEDLFLRIEATRSIEPGSKIRASRSNVINELVRGAFSEIDRTHEGHNSLIGVKGPSNRRDGSD